MGIASPSCSTLDLTWLCRSDGSSLPQLCSDLAVAVDQRRRLLCHRLGGRPRPLVTFHSRVDRRRRARTRDWQPDVVFSPSWFHSAPSRRYSLPESPLTRLSESARPLPSDGIMRSALVHAGLRSSQKRSLTRSIRASKGCCSAHGGLRVCLAPRHGRR